MNETDSALRELVAEMRSSVVGQPTYIGATKLTPGFISDWASQIESILATPQAAPAGMVLVPREPTHEWVDAFMRHTGYTDEEATETIEFLLAAAPAAQVAHTDDIAVDKFAAAMKEKLAAARAKGRGGWDDREDLEQHLSNLLRAHVEKGDPRDVANFCCFLWNRGESICAAPAVVVDEAMASWIADGDTIPSRLINACREAIRREFGNNGTDGYYKRILVKVFCALTEACVPAMAADTGVNEGEVLRALSDHITNKFTTQAAFAAAKKVSTAYVSDVIKGRREVPGDWVFELGYIKNKWGRVINPLADSSALVDEAVILALDEYLWREHGVALGKTAMRAALAAALKVSP